MRFETLFKVMAACSVALVIGLGCFIYQVASFTRKKFGTKKSGFKGFKSYRMGRRSTVSGNVKFPGVSVPIDHEIVPMRRTIR